MPPQRTCTKGITSSKPWETSARLSSSLMYPNTCKLRRKAIHQRARIVLGRISVDYASSFLSVLPHSDLVEFFDCWFELVPDLHCFMFLCRVGNILIQI